MQPARRPNGAYRLLGRVSYMWVAHRVLGRVSYVWVAYSLLGRVSHAWVVVHVSYAGLRPCIGADRVAGPLLGGLYTTSTCTPHRLIHRIDLYTASTYTPHRLIHRIDLHTASTYTPHRHSRRSTGTDRVLGPLLGGGDGPVEQLARQRLLAEARRLVPPPQVLVHLPQPDRSDGSDDSENSDDSDGLG